MAWLSDYQYRKKFSLSRGDGSVSNYQRKLIVHSGSGLAFGNEMCLESGAQNWPNDVRFTASDGETLLGHWLETSDANSAMIWINFDSIGISKTHFFCYFGKPDATSASSIPDTFIREITGVQGSWHLDDKLDPTADTSGNDNSGDLVNGPTWTTGKFNNAVDFDGIDDYVDLGTGLNDLISTDVTVEAWVKASTFSSSASQGIVTEDYAPSTNNVVIKLCYDDTVPAWVTGVHDGVWHKAQGGSPATGSWFHLVGTYDGATLILYENKIQVDSLSFTDGLPVGDEIWTIGRRHDNFDVAASYWHGIIDEVCVYSQALTSAEISDLYNNYGYTTLNYTGSTLVRNLADPEPDWGNWKEAEILSTITPIQKPIIKDIVH